MEKEEQLNKKFQAQLDELAKAVDQRMDEIVEDNFPGKTYKQIVSIIRGKAYLKDSLEDMLVDQFLIKLKKRINEQKLL